MYCTVCEEAAQTNKSIAVKNSFIIGSISKKHESLARHQESSNHRLAIEITHAKKNPFATPAAKIISDLNKDVIDKMCILFRNAHALAVQNRPLSDFVWMTLLDQSKGISVGNTYLNIKSVKQFQACIADVTRSQMRDKISTAKFLSVLLDGTTDTSITEQKMFFIRYAEKGEVQTEFIGVMSVDRGTAPNIFQAF